MDELSDLPLDKLSLDQISFDIHAILAGLLFGVIGWWLFRYGRRTENRRYVIVGLLLMIYPYFVEGPWLNWGIGSLLCGYAYYWWD